jgi:glycosyltransferase involved in cell wall biosynthesis
VVKVLITIDWYLPGTNSGGPVRSISNLVRALPEVSFFLLTRNQDYCSGKPYTDVPSDVWIQHSSNVRIFYFSSSELRKSNLHARILEVKPDVLFINGVYSRKFSRWPLKVGRLLNIPMVVSARGMLSPHSLQVKPLRKFLFLNWMRLTNGYSEVSFHATTPDEEADIRRILGAGQKVVCIPNLPDLSVNVKAVLPGEKSLLRLVSIGRIAPEKGTIHAIQALAAQKEQIRLDIYGSSYNTQYWNDCQAQIANLPFNVVVRYHGPCSSAEVPGILAGAHALLMPSEGENYGHAIVESLAVGRPVIISKNTPWKDLALTKAGWDVNSADLGKCIDFLARLDLETYHSWCLGARTYFEEIILSPINKHIEHYRNIFQKTIT